ncbi:MAG: cyclic nucleotide-binding domain-containing protein [Acidobacteriota bacterium]|nr:cyclic nucleotide-binding domain-containing protein [Acidobacteriota bacterium]
MNETVPHPSMVARLVELARRLRTLRRPSEAAELLKIAAALTPHGADLREEAARLHGEEGIDDFDREFKRRNLEASHALGMAHIFETRGEFERAIDMIDLAKLRTPFNYLAYAAAGYLHIRHGDAATALSEFTQARRLNPLDYRLAIESSRAALENENFDAALKAAIDAMLLATWRSEREQHQERRRVETLVRLSKQDPEQVEKLMAARISTLQKACDHVALSHAKIFSHADLPSGRDVSSRNEPISDDLLLRANELRTMGLFRHFSDELLIPLARIVVPESVAAGEAVFTERDASRDLKIIRQGSVHITRSTPVGTQVLTSLSTGALFGEVSYLDSLPRSATALAVGPTSVFTIPAEALDQAVSEDRELAVSLLWGFWQTLADKVRSANLQMNELFGAPATPAPAQRVPTNVGQRVHLTEESKVDILREQGLSAQELRLLAKYSREQSFQTDAMIFAEGDPGDSLYIVVDGAVRISRMVPGMGEECLLILSRGEVFGELALIDDRPRSADARAHGGPCTVFAVSKSLLEEVLSMDPDAAVQFLNLLCRLLCRRLRAMNERLVAWRVMGSHM